MFVCYKPLSAMGKSHALRPLQCCKSPAGYAGCCALYNLAYLQSDLGNLVPSMITLLISLRLKMRGGEAQC